jgi:hypothetical protein
MKFLVEPEEVQLLFSMGHSTLYDFKSEGHISPPIHWNGERKVMFCLETVANELANNNNLTPPSEQTLQQFCALIMLDRRSRLNELKLVKKAKRAAKAQACK